MEMPVDPCDVRAEGMGNETATTATCRNHWGKDRETRDRTHG